MKKLLVLTLLGALVSAYATTSSLKPLAPVQASVDSNLSQQQCCPVAVSNRSNEIFVVWTDTTSGVFGSWSYDNGVTWSSAPVPIPVGPNGSLGYPFLASNNTGFVFTFIDVDTTIPSSVFYNSSSGTWGPQVSIDDTITDASGITFVNATPQGFLATFLDGSGNGYANLSPDGTTWQTPSQVLFTYGAGYNVTSISGCGNASLLLTTWVDGGTGDVYVSTSSDGSSWSTPNALLTGVSTQSPPSSSGCFANSQGFLIVYLDASANFWSIFSSNGTDWTSPSLVANTNGFSYYYQTPQVSGSDAGFITTWVNNNNYTAYASFSKDGQNWEAPVQFSPSYAFEGLGLYYLFAVTSVYKGLCLFSWSDNAGNIFVCTSSFPSPGSTPIGEKKWGFTAPVLLNRPGKHF